MDRLVARLTLAAAGLLVIAVLVGVTAVFLCIALDLALQSWLAPPLAALATAGILLAAGLIIALVVVLAARSHRTANEPLATRLNRELTGLASKHTAGAVGAALLAGFAVGAVPPLRDALKSILVK